MAYQLKINNFKGKRVRFDWTKALLSSFSRDEHPATIPAPFQMHNFTRLTDPSTIVVQMLNQQTSHMPYKQSCFARIFREKSARMVRKMSKKT
jgi:hypothetical protein